MAFTEFETTTRQELFYPESDGKPIAETQIHMQQIFDLILTLRHHFADEPMVYIWGDMLMYYEEGNPKVSVAPDVFLAKGVKNEIRRTYKVWEEGKAPDLVVEVSSKSTWEEDVGRKKAVYNRLGVTEYYLFDPLKEYLQPQLLGYILMDDEYVRMEAAGGRLKSEVTGLEFGIYEGKMRVFQPGEAEPLPTPDEEFELRKEAEALQKQAEVSKREVEQERDETAGRLSEAEEEIERLKVELAKLKQ